MARIDRLVRTKTLTGVIECRSGLHIGAGKDAVEIGGMDLPVIRDPLTHRPIVPGSSLKGKLRSLLEWHLGCLEPNGNPWGWGDMAPYQDDDPILCVFGALWPDWAGGPTRLLVRDAMLDEQWAQEVVKKGLPFTEEKTEVSIDRVRGKALHSGPHNAERVPAGARFRFEMSYRVFSVDGDDGDGDEKRFGIVLDGLKLLESDALGGAGSRGYGRVRFVDLCIDGESVQKRFDELDPSVHAA